MQTSVKDKFAGKLVDGDAFNTGILTVPQNLLTPHGLTDLTGCTISAAFRDDPTGTPVDISATIENAENRTVSASMDPFKVEMSLGALVDDLRKIWHLDIQIKVTATGTIITIHQVKVEVVWQRDETT